MRKHYPRHREFNIDEQLAWCEPDPEKIPTDELQDLRDKIAKEQAFIEKYPNYPILCKEAQARIRYYQRRLERLEEQALEMEAEEFKALEILVDYIPPEPDTIGDATAHAYMEVGSREWFESLPEIEF